MVDIFRRTYSLIDKKQFYLWLFVLIAMISTEILATVVIPVWREYFYNGIEAKSWNVFTTGIFYFTSLMSVFALVQSFKYYISKKISFNLRTGMSELLEKAWKKKLKTKSQFDNPDQRIQEDVRIATELALNVLIEFAISAIIVICLLFQISGQFYMFELSVLYIVAVSILAALFHRKMVDSEKKFQRAEADYRFTLATTSLQAKWQPTESVYANVKTQYMYLIKVLMGFSIFSSFKSNLIPVVPLLVLVPAYFSGDITFGEIMKGVSQFELLVINATILIIVYPNITKVIASYERLSEFYFGLQKK